MTNAITLLLAFTLGLDHSGTLVSAQEGGDPHEASATDSLSSGQDVQADAADAGPRPAVSVFPSSDSGAEPPITSLPAPESPTTAVCQCQGYKRDLCKCLNAGVKCHCSQTSGSVWELAGGQWIKTGAKADPRREGDEPRLGTGVVTLRNDGRWYWHDGDQWRVTSNQPVEGQRYSGNGGAFVYRNGKMQPEMVARIERTGHWVRQCTRYGCRNVWVWD